MILQRHTHDMKCLLLYCSLALQSVNVCYQEEKANRTSELA